MNNLKSENTRYFQIIVIALLSILVLKTCSLNTSKLNKKVDALIEKVDTLPSKTDVKIEGLKVEKRLIQSTDRKIIDVNRQAEIDKELKILNRE